MGFTRRDFFGSLPGLALAPSLQPAHAADPLLSQILASASELAREKPTSRDQIAAALSALEQNILMMAAYMEAHPDRALKAALKRADDRRGRASVLNRLRATLPSERVVADFELGNRVLDRLRREGNAPSLRELARAVRKWREKDLGPVQFILVRQDAEPICENFRRQIEIQEWNMAAWCLIALVEPTPAGEAMCAWMTANWLALKANCYWWCGWQC
jgi:hypothetical protein